MNITQKKIKKNEIRNRIENKNKRNTGKRNRKKQKTNIQKAK